MKKLSIFNLIFILIILDIFLIGCDNKQRIDSELSNEEVSFFQAYENYVKSMGKTAIEYEDFLAFIKSEDGENGNGGVDGINGKSAYELALENGFTGSVEEWLISLKGERGDNGENGKNGANGTNGKDGNSITSTTINENGNLIITYSNGEIKDCGKVVGANGKDGLDGRDGINGTNGKDGLNGNDGKQGLQGIQGLQGDKGEKGEQGERGQDGVGIECIEKISSNEIEDTYYIILTNGEFYPFTIPKENATKKSFVVDIDNGSSQDLHYVYDKQRDVYQVVGVGLSSDMDLVISSHYNNKSVRLIYQNAFENQSYIRSVVINDGIYEIGINAFNNCSLLQSVKIPKSVRIFDNSSFENCISLTKIEIEIYNKLQNKYEYKIYNSIEDVKNDIENFTCDENGSITRINF